MGWYPSHPSPSAGRSSDSTRRNCSFTGGDWQFIAKKLRKNRNGLPVHRADVNFGAWGFPKGGDQNAVVTSGQVHP